MELQALLDKTNKVFWEIQINHRNTLSQNKLLHEELGDIKDFLYSFIDDIGEYIIIQWWFTKFNKEDTIDLPDDREDIYTYSCELLSTYLELLKSFYKEEKDMEIQNYMIDKTNELRKLYMKLKSTCPEMAENETPEEEKTEQEWDSWNQD